MKTLITLLVVIFTTTAFSQTQDFTLKGKVVGDGESLPAATILINDLRVYSNLDGDFEVTLPQGEYEIIVDYVSYETDTIPLNLIKDDYIVSELRSRELPKLK